MINYLRAGWHTRPGRLHLRSDVMDGAIDTAGWLYRAAVPAEALTRLALKVRRLTTFIHPVARLGIGSGKFSTRERGILESRLRRYTDRYPPLQGFLSDCFDHVRTVGELRALYLHIIHVSQMMQLLHLAKLSHRRVLTRLGHETRAEARATAPRKAPAEDKTAVQKAKPAKKAASKAPARRAAASVRKVASGKAAAPRRKVTRTSKRTTKR